MCHEIWLFKHRLDPVNVLCEDNVSASPLGFQPAPVQLESAAFKSHSREEAIFAVEHHPAMALPRPPSIPRNCKKLLEGQCLNVFNKIFVKYRL